MARTFQDSAAVRRQLGWPEIALQGVERPLDVASDYQGLSCVFRLRDAKDVSFSLFYDVYVPDQSDRSIRTYLIVPHWRAAEVEPLYRQVIAEAGRIPKSDTATMMKELTEVRASQGQFDFDPKILAISAGTALVWYWSRKDRKKTNASE
jgi:hypothetical protein